MIDKIKLKFGSTSGQPALDVALTPITVFVGPNNSGKSIVLREIENYCRQTIASPTNLLLDNLSFTSYDETSFRSELEKLKQELNQEEILHPDHIMIGKINPASSNFFRTQVHLPGIIHEAANPNKGEKSYLKQFLNMYTIRLDGNNRINLLKDQNAGDLQLNPQNHFQFLFVNDEIRQKVRDIIYDAFRKYFVIDPTNIGKLRVRLSERPPSDQREEKGWDARSIDFHREAIEITRTSDGVKAFTGIMTTLIAGDPRIILIDEPEAFLHPSLSNKLGKEIGNSVRGTNKRLFVSTHSSNFLMGCIQSNTPLNIIRLTYLNDVATARVLPKEKILTLMRNPLLRSTGVLNGLFYESVVVTEADSDRAFYQEINERHLAENNDNGIPNCLFLNAKNKQTVWDIVKPLRELGIPAAGIVDIDAIKEGGQVWSKLLNGGFIPEPSHQSIHNLRVTIKQKFDKTGQNMKRDGGIELLQGQDKEAFSNLLGQLAEYGIFIIPNGELECWLKNLSVTGHGPSWLIDIFEKMGEDPAHVDYVKPENNDVWKFMVKVKGWFVNPNRKGIPD